MAAVVDVPQLGPLGLRVPLPVLVAEREDALLRAGALLVPAGAAEGGGELVLGDGVEQDRRLQPVARLVRAGRLPQAAVVDRRLDRCDYEPRAQLLDAPVAVIERLREVVSRVDVHERERETPRPERLLGEAQQDDRVLAAAEQEDGALELGRDFTHDRDGLGLEQPQIGELAGHGAQLTQLDRTYRQNAACSAAPTSPTARRALAERAVQRQKPWTVPG